MEMAKEQAKKVLESLPDDASWEDIMYKMYVSEKISAGLRDVNEGKVTSHEDVKKRFRAG
jgi:hypothetical protein